MDATAYYQLGQVFRPAAPVDELRLFAGRKQQLAAVIDAVTQPGRHAIIYGERGVGKTSLASIIREYLSSFGQGGVVAVKITTDGTDDFSSIWHKVFGQLQSVSTQQGLGFGAPKKSVAVPLSATLPEKVRPDDVRTLLVQASAKARIIVIIDEFDRAALHASALIADTIKTLSDQATNAVVIIVGVADTVGTLIAEHESIERALAQIQMPRMSDAELLEIVQRGFGEVGYTITAPAQNRIVQLSQGLPHYTHLVALHSGRAAAKNDRNAIDMLDVAEGIQTAVANTQESIRSLHHRAVMSPRRDNLYREVVLACALARTDSLGYFQASDVRDPLSIIVGRRFEIPAFSRHLSELCETQRGQMLTKIGSSRRFRYRFRNPLVQPFTIMDGLASGNLDDKKLETLRETPANTRPL